ncbi:hypothetical protein FACHB389_22250 [Nostoc calcicola FACHB-389]|nr:hypothetical protein [Nostoc calcicola FACHB-3891]OKH31149.1 hypothetical protein FACHB389_22250 [Nostoc calcicola FACHB-389]
MDFFSTQRYAEVNAKVRKDFIAEAAAWGSLGDANRLRGNYQLVITNLEKSLAIANKLNTSELRVSVFNSLANAHRTYAKTL